MKHKLYHCIQKKGFLDMNIQKKHCRLIWIYFIMNSSLTLFQLPKVIKIHNIDGLNKLIEKKKEYKDLKMILHSIQGSIYSLKSFNETLPLYNLTHPISRAGSLTNNSTMKAINGWLKENY